MKTKTRATEEKKKTINEGNLGFKKGMLGKFVSNKQANIRKGKGKQKKNKKQPQRVFSEKGLMDNKQRKKWIFERDDKRKKKNGKKTTV